MFRPTYLLVLDPPTCWHIMMLESAFLDGWYRIDPTDPGDHLDPFDVYCVFNESNGKLIEVKYTNIVEIANIVEPKWTPQKEKNIADNVCNTYNSRIHIFHNSKWRHLEQFQVKASWTKLYRNKSLVKHQRRHLRPIYPYFTLWRWLTRGKSLYAVIVCRDWCALSSLDFGSDFF